MGPFCVLNASRYKRAIAVKEPFVLHTFVFPGLRKLIAQDADLLSWYLEDLSGFLILEMKGNKNDASLIGYLWIVVNYRPASETSFVTMAVDITPDNRRNYRFYHSWQIYAWRTKVDALVRTVLFCVFDRRSREGIV